PILVTFEIVAADQSGGQVLQRAAVTLHEAADVVSELAVPLLPTVADEGADLIQARGVPGFRDQFRTGQAGIRFDVPEDRGILQWPAGLGAGGQRGQVEARTSTGHLRPTI